MIKYCLVCDKEFKTRPARVKSGRGKYCSKECASIASIGKQAWNKGLKGLTTANSGSFKKGEHRSPDTEFKKGENKGKYNHNWKEDGFSTVALHLWVVRELGKPNICEQCGSTQFVQWANKSELYKRDLSDWLQLCAKCHKQYDNEMHKIMGIKSFRERRFS